MFNLYQTIADKRGWKAINELNDRELRILDHYENQLSRGRMDQVSATERCLGDLAGRNYHPKLDQRAF